MPFLTSTFDECNVPYDWENEQVEPFEPYWNPNSNKSVEGLELSSWTYQTQWKLKGTPYWGYFATYWGGGKPLSSLAGAVIVLITRKLREPNLRSPYKIKHEIFFWADPA